MKSWQILLSGYLYGVVLDILKIEPLTKSWFIWLTVGALVFLAVSECVERYLNTNKQDSQ